MSISMYYSAWSGSLTAEEIELVDQHVEEFAIDRVIAEAGNAREDWRGDDYSFYREADGTYESEDECQLKGSTKLACDDEELLAAVIYHLCEALTALRLQLPRFSWDFSLDDIDIPWDDEQQCYDLDAVEE